MRRLLVLILAAACSKGPAPVSIDHFQTAWVEASCAAQERCSPAASYVDAQCRAQQAVAAADVQKAVAAGRLRYDANKAGACIDSIANARCVASLSVGGDPDVCLAALQGTVAPGAACSSEFECAAGLCLPDVGAACPATCPQTLGEGAACNAHAPPDCDVRQGLACIDGVCKRQQPLGGACSLNDECVFGTVCAGGKCAPLRGAGAGCSGDEACGPGLFCVGASDEGNGGCEAQLGAGADCGVQRDDVDAALRGAQCATGLVCQGAGLHDDGTSIAGKCAAPVGAGAPCITPAADVQTQITGCVDGLLCVNGACAEPPGVGQPCGANGACNPYKAYCDGTTCQAIHPQGSACSTDLECGVASNFCANGECEPQSPFCHEP